MIIHKEPHAGPHRKALTPKIKFQRPAHCPLARCSAISMYERELEKHRVTEVLRQKDDLIQQRDILSKESAHRVLNGLQLITSLLSMQSRATKNAEAATQLTSAARRVATIANLHRHLHALDHVESVEFKQ